MHCSNNRVLANLPTYHSRSMSTVHTTSTTHTHTHVCACICIYLQVLPVGGGEQGIDDRLVAAAANAIMLEERCHYVGAGPPVMMLLTGDGNSNGGGDFVSCPNSLLHVIRLLVCILVQRAAVSLLIS
jgi:hypothetical protein